MHVIRQRGYGNCFLRFRRSHAVLYSVYGYDPETGKAGVQVKISDISDAMNLPRPGVTRTVKEMEAKGYLHKFASKEDGRVTYIAITEEGKKLSQKYDKDYFWELALSQ